MKAIWFFGFAVICLVADALVVSAMLHATQSGLYALTTHLGDINETQFALKSGAFFFGIAGLIATIVGAIQALKRSR